MTWPKGTIISIHIIGWLLFLVLPVFFIQAQSADKNTGAILSSWQFWFFVLFYLTLYYLNTLLLLPQLYFKKKIIVYGTTIIVLLVMTWLTHPFDNLVRIRRGFENRPPDREFRMDDFPPPELREEKGPRSSVHVDIVSIFLGVVVVAMGFAAKTAEAWQDTKQQLSEAEKAKLNAELSFLKAQINPHFLFNTLNNLYTLAVTKSDKTAEGIMDLSNIMRYVTDDALADFVSLEKEISCIKDFIELQKLRLTDKTKIEFSITGAIDQKRIGPLLLMTFVENCFKYGTSNHESASIIIRINTSSNRVVFYCENKIFNRLTIAERNAVGIYNAQQRLQHLYPGHHELLISESDGLFTVELTIKD
jgi:hypothetical protein